MNLKRFFQRSGEDTEISQELESHLEHEIDDNLARGMSADEARRRAYVKLGNPLRIRDKVWEATHVAWIGDTWRDLRYAARTLGKAPSFTLVAVLVMALGIGANTAIYSFLDSLLLRSLPVSDPGSLVVVNWHAKASLNDFVMQSMSGDVDYDARLGSVSDIFPYPSLAIFQRNDAVFSNVFAYSQTREVRSVSVSVNGQADIASGELVTGGYFDGLGIRPASGRVIIPDDDRVSAPLVVVVSHAFSEKRLGGAASAAGQSILINNLPFTVIGVAPAEFFGVDPASNPDFYVPMHSNLVLGAGDPFRFQPADYLDGNYYWLQVMARLRPGVTLAQGQAALIPQFGQWVATTATTDAQRATLPEIYLKEGAGGLDTLRRQFSKPLYVLLTLVGLILAIACSNVANLLLVRAASRRREIALRLTEGASRMRVVRQLLTESILLAAMGGALGVLIAVEGIRFLTVLLAGSADRVLLHAELNWHVLAVTAGLALLTGIVFGLVPALQSTKVDLVSALKETKGTLQRPRASAVRFRFLPANLSQVLVIGQIAISLVILVAAGLFARTLSNLQSINLGFNRNNLLLFELNAAQSGHINPELADFYFRLREGVAGIHGIESAGIAHGSLVGGENQIPICTPGHPPDRENRYLAVGPEFLTTMQIPILLGRDIDERDRPNSPKVAVVNEQFARKNFPGEDPLGKHIHLLKGVNGEVMRDMEIVGVARNAHYGGLRNELLPVVYLPYNQGYPLPDAMMFALRTAGDPLSYVNSVREIIHQADARLPMSSVRTQKAEIEGAMHQEIMLAELCSAFAALALTIACVGLYGTISNTVVRRTGEIGIRIALGAERGPVLWMVLREVLVLAAVGLAISLPITLGASRFVGSFLFGLKPNDPLTLGIAVTVLLGAAFLAGCVPARRASRIDPMTALRHE
jgi:predicted permease